MTFAYHLMYDCGFESPVTPLWNLIAQPERRPEWWPSIQRVVCIDEGQSRGVGAVHRFTAKTPIRVPLSFEVMTTVAEHLGPIQYETTGRYALTEYWYFFPLMRGTQVRHSLCIEFTESWMKLVIPRFYSRLSSRYCKILAQAHEGLRRVVGES